MSDWFSRNWRMVLAALLLAVFLKYCGGSGYELPGGCYWAGSGPTTYEVCR